MPLKGKFALTNNNPANFKWALVKAGAVGAINAFTENSDLHDGRQWINAWGDNGWAFTKGSTPLISFSISPRQAALLRKLLAEHGKVRLKATVDSRYYAGVYPYVTGVIPGTSPEEVLTLGHAFVLRVAEEYFSKIGRPWHSHPYMSGTDTYLAEPTVNVPTVWPYSGSGVHTHHSSEDTPDRVDPRSLRDVTAVNASYLYFLANASEPEALWLAELSQTRGYAQILQTTAPFLDHISTGMDAERSEERRVGKECRS